MNKGIISIYLNEWEKSTPLEITRGRLFLTGSMGKTYISGSDKITKKIAENFAKELILGNEKTVILGLEGDLGGGKTTFAQGFAKGLGIKEKILSPTFAVIKRFKLQDLTRLPERQGFKNFYHIDAYRLQKPDELLMLGWKEIISTPGNIVLVEWADRIKKILPKNALIIYFEHIGKNKRKLLFL